MPASGEGHFHARVRNSSRHFFWIGLALTSLGIVAIVFPMISTIVATVLVGWLLFASGLFILLGSFVIRGTGPFFGALLLSLLSLVAGAFLLSNPGAGALVLTLLLALLFMIEGAFEIVLAIEMRPLAVWIYMLLAALASILLGLLIAIGLPVASAVVLGLLMGLNFLSTGIGYLLLSRGARTF